MHALPKLNSSAVRLSVVGLAIFAAACGDKRAADRSAADSDLARDLALAGAPAVQQPTFQDTAIAPAPAPAARANNDEHSAPKRTTASTRPQPHIETPRPVAQAPAPQPVAPQQQASVAPAPAPSPARGEIGAGTSVALTTGSKVCTSTSLPGDKLVATVNSDMTGSNGAVIPAGSSVVLEVASVNPGDNGNGAQITFRVRSIVANDKTYTVPADVTTLSQLERTKEPGDPNAEKKKVIGGAIAGAILGQIIGHNTKGTVIGAATGAAAGAAASRASERWEGCLPAGAALRLVLDGPVAM